MKNLKLWSAVAVSLFSVFASASDSFQDESCLADKKRIRELSGYCRANGKSYFFKTEVFVTRDGRCCVIAEDATPGFVQSCQRVVRIIDWTHPAGGQCSDFGAR